MESFKKVGIAALLSSCVLAAAVFLYYGHFAGCNSAEAVIEEHVAKTTEDVACLEKQLKEVEKKMSHMYQALGKPSDSCLQAELSQQEELEHELMVLTAKISGLLDDHKQMLASVGSDNKKTMYQKFKMKLENAFVTERS